MTTLFTMNADAKEFVGQQLVGAQWVEFAFDIAIDGWLKVDENPRPSLLRFQRAVGYSRSDGRMYDTRPVSAAPVDITDSGSVGVRLPANDAEFVLSGDVTYDVTVSRWVNGTRVLVMKFNTGVVPAADVSVNLADYAPAPGGTGDGGDGGSGDGSLIDGGSP